MTENKQNPTPVDIAHEEPDDPGYYLQRMYDLAVEPIEGEAGRGQGSVAK